MIKVIAVDPGMSTGVVEATVNNGEVKVVGRAQLEGGLKAVTEVYNAEMFADWELDYLVVEKFSPLPTARAYRLNELEPIRIEGALQAMVDGCWRNVEFVPQRTMALSIAGSHGSPAKNKKAADDYLRDAGLWTTGKVVGCRDADDVNAAMKHLVAFARSQGWADPHEWKVA